MIEVIELCADYGKNPVLNKVSMELETGKITAIIGPNGCGKSTLLKTLVRIHHHSRGEIRINGTPIETLSSIELARHVAYLPQNKRPPDISVLKMVLHGRFAYLNYPRRYRKQDIEIAKQALAWAGMEEKENEAVTRLSGGMQQKVYIAMALAQNTETILLDEPTTYLDIAYQLRLMEMMKRLAREGKAVVIVLHDLTQALRIADKIVVMKEGEILGQGRPEKIVESGILPRVFEVEIEPVKGRKGWHYLCDSLLPEEQTEGER
ncbi:MAG: ABC transporter ATP-binding protein [Lachnospiraceae bacterium]|nr:ABC transporter ATP-binding protein [Lachnospiraceae bacterium]MDY3224099.1 ABC transporter ATP-binding protein [Lachnospiraceae bacterium]